MCFFVNLGVHFRMLDHGIDIDHGHCIGHGGSIDHGHNTDMGAAECHQHQGTLINILDLILISSVERHVRLGDDKTCCINNSRTAEAVPS